MAYASEPISLTQMDEGDYTGPLPRPVVVVGTIPGAEGGVVDEVTAGEGIAVDSTDPAAPEVSLDLTGVADYDDQETQTLKHIEGVLTWVTDVV